MSYISVSDNFIPPNLATRLLCRTKGEFLDKPGLFNLISGAKAIDAKKLINIVDGASVVDIRRHQSSKHQLTVT